MKRRIIALLVIVVVSLYIVQLVHAEEPQKENEKQNKGQQIREKLNDKKLPEKIAKNVPDKAQLLMRHAFKKTDSETMNKLNRLEAKHLNRLSALKPEGVEKLGKVKQGRLKVLAENDMSNIAELNQEEIEKASELDRARLKQLAMLTPEQASARLKKISLVEADENFKMREIAHERKEAMRQEHEQLKGKREKLKEQNRQRMETLNEAKQELKNCENETTEENCAKKRDKAIEHAKAAALQAIERLEAHLENLKNKMQENENMDETTAAKRTETIDAAITEIQSIKPEIETATTKEELNNAVQRLRKAISKAKSSAEESEHTILKAQITGTMHRAEITEKKIDCTLNRLQEDGTDTSAIDEKLSEYSSLIAEARSRISEAKEAFSKEPERSKEMLRQARDAVKAAQEKLVEIKNELKTTRATLCVEKQEIAIGAEDE